VGSCGWLGNEFKIYACFGREMNDFRIRGMRVVSCECLANIGIHRSQRSGCSFKNLELLLLHLQISAYLITLG
jgi:hypothetical protein